MRAEDGSTVNPGFYSALGPGIYRGADGQLYKRQTISRRLEQQARKFADHVSDQSARQNGMRPIVATVSAVSAGGAADGNALVAVRWRDQQVTVAGYAASYTPAVGHRVMCLLVDSQLVIAFRIVGHP